MFFSKSAVFTSNGTWVPPATTSLVMLMMLGAGASGANGDVGGGGSGNEGVAGGTGELVMGLLVSVVPGNSYTVTIGVGGVAPAAGASAQGVAGTDSSFGIWKALGAPAFDPWHGPFVNAGPGGGCIGWTNTGATNAEFHWLPQYETTVHANGIPGSNNTGGAGLATDLRAGSAFSRVCIGTPGTSNAGHTPGYPGGGTLQGHGGDGGNAGALSNPDGGNGTWYGSGGGAGGGPLSGQSHKCGNGAPGLVQIFYN